MQHQILGWAGYVRIDGASYEWLGAATTYGSATNLTATTITPTRTVFTIHAGPMNLNVTFLSPIEVRRHRICPLYPVNEVFDGSKPGDWTLQSLPFAYMYLEAWSTDGNAHSVQVYSDLTAGALIPHIPLFMHRSATLSLPQNGSRPTPLRL